MGFRKIWSYIIQLIAIVIIIYLVSFKSEITPKDVVNMVFWCTMFLIEEIRQVKWIVEPKEEETEENDDNN